jgi:hypothetical protein
VLGLTVGEFGLVAFIVVAILTARYFPAMGERAALALTRRTAKQGSRSDDLR